ncbi:hypothetical protein F1B92_02905 [Campylobacter sp. FMV-PI01]|uniref:Uncharacterized protein n=1 Tax=Campylobacter portucalensis TaxID=2608384 RepID=A0A6L5WJW9_9BACT|nr:hypothetical protein [Campylobacter portucalensis]MSN96153.1 hypothetical protein [Campylobacter portucalensis]
MNRVGFFILIIFAVFVSGCVQTFSGYSSELNKYGLIYDSKSCDDKFIDEKIKTNSDLLMWYELGGSMKRNCLDYNASNFYFDQAEDLYKTNVDLENFASKGTKTATSILLNDNIDSYRGGIYESIMLNVYKGLNFMSMNDFNSARVEFNRALDRQRRAKDEFKNEIENKIASLENENKDAIQAAQNEQTQKTIYGVYNRSVFADFVAYPDFVNPFATYMAGLFFFADKDYKKAYEMFKESLAMQPKNKFLQEEFELSQNLLLSKNRNQNFIWLIYENGKSAIKDEIKIDIPLFIFTDEVPYVGISLPTLTNRANSYEYLIIADKKTYKVADMDRVIKTEFSKQLPFIITKSIIRTAIKTIINYQIYSKDETIGLGVAVFNAITNKSDVRSWVSLPKNFQVARVLNDGENIAIKTPDGDILENVLIAKNKSAIIYINSPIKGSINLHKIFF